MMIKIQSNEKINFAHLLPDHADINSFNFFDTLLRLNLVRPNFILYTFLLLYAIKTISSLYEIPETV